MVMGQMRIQKAESEGREKVAASLVRSFVANLFAPPTVFSLLLALGMQEKRLSRLLTARGVVILRGLQEEVLG